MTRKSKVAVIMRMVTTMSGRNVFPTKARSKRPKLTSKKGFKRFLFFMKLDALSPDSILVALPFVGEATVVSVPSRMLSISF